MKNLQCQFYLYHYFELIMCIFCINLRTKKKKKIGVKSHFFIFNTKITQECQITILIKIKLISFLRVEENLIIKIK